VEESIKEWWLGKAFITCKASNYIEDVKYMYMLELSSPQDNLQRELESRIRAKSLGRGIEIEYERNT
jgi:hypothetical protein